MKRIEERYVLKKSVKRFINKLLILIIIILVGMISIKLNPSLKKDINKYLYEDTFNFIKPKKIYEKYFGNILSEDKLLNKEKSVFNEKINYNKEESYQNGVKLTVDNNYSVPIIESGVVIYIDKKTNNYIVEQVDGIKTSYSNITSNIKLYDYVEKGDILGQTKGNKLYLKFQKEGKYLNYKEYI